MDSMEALTPEQQSFAADHHGILIAFMEKYQLDRDYYGDLAQRYLKTVIRYLNEDHLQQYSFSTVAWQHLRSELSNIARRLENEVHVLPLNADSQVYADYEEPIDSELWKCIEEVLTYKQVEVILLRNQGYSNREIAYQCGISRKAVEKRFARVRKILSKLLKEYQL